MSALALIVVGDIVGILIGCGVREAMRHWGGSRG
jgi:hypothetical protein